MRMEYCGIPGVLPLCYLACMVHTFSFRYLSNVTALIASVGNMITNDIVVVG